MLIVAPVGDPRLADPTPDSTHVERARKEAVLDELRRRAFDQGAWLGLACGLIAGATIAALAAELMIGSWWWAGYDAALLVGVFVFFWRASRRRS